MCFAGFAGGMASIAGVASAAPIADYERPAGDGTARSLIGAPVGFFEAEAEELLRRERGRGVAVRVASRVPTEGSVHLADIDELSAEIRGSLWRNDVMTSSVRSGDHRTAASGWISPAAVSSGPVASRLPSEWESILSEAAGDEDISGANVVPEGAEESEAPKTNYRGEQPPAGEILYFNDFEGDEAGVEWEGSLLMTEMVEYGRFAGPFFSGSEAVVNVLAETSEGLSVRFDLYVLSMSSVPTPGDETPDGPVASLVADGVDVWEMPVADLVARATAASENAVLSPDAPVILRDIKVGFQPLAPIAEIRFSVSGASLSSVVWGIDNVIVDKEPEETFGAFGSGDVSVLIGLDGATLTGSRNPFPNLRVARGPGIGGGGGGNGNNSGNPFPPNDVVDDDGPDEEPPENRGDEDASTPPPGDDPPPNDQGGEVVPAPGPAMLFGLAMGAWSSRRRR